MAGKDLDNLAKDLAEERISRGKALKRMGAALLGGLLAASPAAAFAAPRTCVVCQCGTGNPCNVKITQCQETRGFPATTVCQDFCERRGQRLCGAGSPFHCPRGC